LEDFSRAKRNGNRNRRRRRRRRFSALLGTLGLLRQSDGSERQQYRQQRRNGSEAKEPCAYRQQ